MADRRRELQMRQSLCFSIENRNSGARVVQYPERAGSVLEHAHLTELEHRHVQRHLAGRAVEGVNSGPGRNPKSARTILQCRLDVGAAQAARVGRIMAESPGLAAGWIEPEQPVARREP